MTANTVISLHIMWLLDTSVRGRTNTFNIHCWKAFHNFGSGMEKNTTTLIEIKGKPQQQNYEPLF